MVLDHEGGRRARDEALANLEKNEDGVWRQYAYEAFEYCAKFYQEFTTDDVWETLSKWNIPFPHEPRSMGWVTNTAIKNKVAVNTGTYSHTGRKSSHHRPIPTYKSLIMVDGLEEE